MTVLNNTSDITRGTIALIDLPLTGNSVQGGIRPVVIVSNDKGNKFSPVLIVVPLTSRTKRSLPTHYQVTPTLTNGLKNDSTALCEQILTVGKESIRAIMGKLDNQDITFLNNKIKASLSLF